MMGEVQILRMVLASPSDVRLERDILPTVIEEINRIVGRDRGVRIDLYKWETDGRPGFHVEGPQGILDPILGIEECDILIGIFWRRFGTPTKGRSSGTEYEILKAYDTFKQKGRPQIWVYFNQEVPTLRSSTEAGQYAKVLKFKEKLSKLGGLWWAYDGEAKFGQTVRQQLTSFVLEHYPTHNPSTETINESLIIRRSAEYAAYTTRNIEELNSSYSLRLAEKIGKLHISDEPEPRDLETSFVPINIIERYHHPTQLLDIDEQLLQVRGGSVDKTHPTDEPIEDKYSISRVIKPNQLLQGRVRAFITGGPGCGKTTLLKYLACKTLKAKKRFTIFLELKSVTDEALKYARGNLAELLFDKAVAVLLHLSLSEKEEFKSFFLDCLAESEAAIFLDGLDELRGTEFFPDICNSIRDFADSAYGDNMLVISTRPYMLLGKFEGLKEMEITPLTIKQTKAFVAQHYGNYPAEKRTLNSDRGLSQLRDLARFPFLLAVIVRFDRNHIDASINRLDIYRQIVRKMTLQLDVQKLIRQPNYRANDTEGSLKLAFLKQLAFERLVMSDLHSERADREYPRFVFTGDTLNEQVRRFLEEENLIGSIPVHQFVAYVKDSPFIREVDDDVYAFTHLTIQEYLAAEALVRRKDREKIICSAIFDPVIVEMEILPMVFGMASDADLLYASLEQLPESLNFANLRLQARGLAYVKKIKFERLKDLASRIVQFVSNPKAEEVPFVRAMQRTVVSTRGDALDLILEGFLSLLNPDNFHKSIYLRAISSIGKTGDDRAVPALKEAILRGDSSICMRATDALVEIGSLRAVAALIEAAKEGSDLVRWNVSDGIRRLGDERAISHLIEALKDSSSSIRGHVADVLGTIGGELALKALIGVLENKNERDEVVRSTAALALGRIGDDRAVSVLRKASRQGFDSVRNSSILALGLIGGQEGTDELIRALSDRSIIVRENAVASLGRLGDEKAAPELAHILLEQSKELEIGQWKELAIITIEALAQIGGDAAVEVLTKGLKDKNHALREKIIEALGNIGGHRARSALVEALEDENRKVRYYAQRALDETSMIKSLPSEVQVQREKLVRKSRASADFILNAGKDRVAMCIDMLRSSNMYLRWSVAEALERMNHKELSCGLANALGYHVDFVRRKAIESIVFYSDDKELSNTLAAIASSDRDVAVRRAADQARRQFLYKMLLLDSSSSEESQTKDA